MNYYIQGCAAKADKIKAAFEDKGYDTTGWKFNVEGVFYYTHEGRIDLACGKFLINLIKTHPDYKELELPVEPKFKVHDWVVDGDRVAIIYDLQKNGYVGHDINRKDFVCRYSDEGRLHLWTIADAKDGDVLATDNGWTCIFKAFDGYGFSSYCFMDSQKWFCEVGAEGHTLDSRINGNIHPATKEQRDIFFHKMKEAGYQWDSDNKELHKIQPHYDIKNFKPFDKVLVRCADDEEWAIEMFSKYYDSEPTIHGRTYRFMCIADSYTQCIPFEGNEHLLGTTDMPSEEFINW